METKELNFYEKIIKIQNLLKVPKKKGENVKYKFRSCEEILEEIKPMLLAEGLLLTLTDSLISENGRNYIKATVIVTNGKDKIESEALAREDFDNKFMSSPQSTGSSSSYARKYALGGLFLLDDSKDADHIADEQASDNQKLVDSPSFDKPPFTSSDFMKFCEWCQTGVSEEEIEKTVKTIYIKKTVSKEQNIEIKDFLNNLFKNRDVK